MIKENIISNYYIKHQKVKEISEELGVYLRKNYAQRLSFKETGVNRSLAG